MMPDDSLRTASEQLFNVSCLVGSLKALVDDRDGAERSVDSAQLADTFEIIEKQILEAYVTVSDYDAQLKEKVATELTTEGAMS